MKYEEMKAKMEEFLSCIGDGKGVVKYPFGSSEVWMKISETDNELIVETPSGDIMWEVKTDDETLLFESKTKIVLDRLKGVAKFLKEGEEKDVVIAIDYVNEIWMNV